jgi:hypothetical protein
VDELIESIRFAVAPTATIDQRAAGVAACRALLTALGAEVGKPFTPAAVGITPPPRPLSGLTIDQALDLAIAKLRSMVPAESAPAPTASLAIPLVGVPRGTP